MPYLIDSHISNKLKLKKNGFLKGFLFTFRDFMRFFRFLTKNSILKFFRLFAAISRDFFNFCQNSILKYFVCISRFPEIFFFDFAAICSIVYGKSKFTRFTHTFSSPERTGKYEPNSYTVQIPLDVFDIPEKL